jgi:hypothetical protein
MPREKLKRPKLRGESTGARAWGGPTRTSVEGPVIGPEQRGRVRTALAPTLSSPAARSTSTARFGMSGPSHFPAAPQIPRITSRNSAATSSPHDRHRRRRPGRGRPPGRAWIVPAGRLKGRRGRRKRDHYVPLSDRALEILTSCRRVPSTCLPTRTVSHCPTWRCSSCRRAWAPRSTPGGCHSSGKSPSPRPDRPEGAVRSNSTAWTYGATASLFSMTRSFFNFKKISPKRLVMGCLAAAHLPPSFGRINFTS